MRNPDQRKNLRLIEKLKKRDSSNGRANHIPVGPDLSLAAVGPWVLEEPQIIEDLVSWRAENRASFFAQVPRSTSSMRNYLKNYAISDPRRILFVIFWEGTHVGHVGLSKISINVAELDNVIRGVATYPGMMADVLAFLKIWAFEHLAISGMYLRVKRDNHLAIALYSRAGFKPVSDEIDQHLIQEEIVSLHEAGGLMMASGLENDYPESNE